MTPEQYLQEHSLDPDFVKNLGWEWSNEKITIPYYDSEGNLLHCRYRNLVGKNKFESDSGSKITLYATHKIKNKKVVVLCEGEPDCAKLWQEGIPATTAGGVTSLTAKIAAPLADKEVLLILDNDKAGRDALSKYVDILVSIGATPLIVKLPDGAKDVCEYFAQGNDKEAFQDVLTAAQTYDQWQEDNRPKEFAILSGEVLLQRNFPPQRWLIKRMVPMIGITFLIGSEGVGKSFNALTMADSIANKTPWLKRFDVESYTNVLILDKENSLIETQDRMKALKINGKGLFFLEFPQHFSFDPENDIEEFSPFALYVKEFVEKNNIGFIVIDSFVDLMTGNENSSQDTQIFFTTIKQLFYDKSILILHHAGKANGIVPRTSSEKTRGSTNIPAQAFSSLYLSKLPKRDNEYSVEQTKLRGGGTKIKKFKVEMEIHIDPYDKESSQVIGLHYRGEIEDEEGKESRCEDLIISLLSQKDQMQRMELEGFCQSAGIPKSTFKKIFDKLVSDNILLSEKDPKNGLRKVVSLL